MMIVVKTNKPIAYDSLDHLHPWGTVRDNNSRNEYVQEVKKHFNDNQISVIDLGCAGGQIIRDHCFLGDIGVGLEGSSNVLGGNGRTNWEVLYNKNLFLCDITEKFDIENDGVRLLFDYAQMWEVLEHIPEQKLPTLLSNIKNHLKPGGLFCGSVATHWCDSGTHVSIFPRDKWVKIFNDCGFVMNNYIFENLPRYISDGTGGSGSGFVFTASIQ